jgi:hypothetical protein
MNNYGCDLLFVKAGKSIEFKSFQQWGSKYETENSHLFPISYNLYPEYGIEGSRF